MVYKRDAKSVFGGGLRPVSGHLDSPTLPELAPEIVPDNLHAAAALYYAGSLDSLGLFAVADEVVRAFIEGERGSPDVAVVRSFWRARGDRPPADQRAAACARVAGCGPGADRGDANREAPSLLDRWLHLTAATDTDPEITAALARGLAGNLSRRSSPLVREIHGHVRAAVELLASPEALNAFAVATMWQLVERVASRPLRLGVDVMVLRARAVAGTAALEWLADHAASADFAADESLVHIAASWASA